MDLINMLINPAKLKSTCFLCFAQNEDTLGVHEKLSIYDEYQTRDTTLASILTYLFPTVDILFGQACPSCSTFLLKGFLLLQKHKNMTDILCKLTEILDNKVPSVKTEVNSSNVLHINLKMPDISKLSPYLAGDDKSVNTNTEIIEKHKYLYCNKCDMKFMSKHLLGLHKKITHRNQNNAAICEFCGKKCTSSAALKIHLNCHKEKSCPHCYKVLKSHSHFKIHVKNHEGNVKKPSRKSQYACNVCPFRSLNKDSLQAHVNKVHLQTRPFVCYVCNKGFYKKSNLTEHMMIHKKIKNLTCEQCGDNFVSKKTLIEHLRLHSGERPFQCELCSLTFVTSGRRSDHFKRKHMEKTVCCFICDKKFSLKKELNSHMKKIHGQSKNTEEFHSNKGNNMYNDVYCDSKELIKL